MIYYEQATGYQQIYKCTGLVFELFEIHYAKVIVLWEMLSQQANDLKVFQINPLRYTSIEQRTLLRYVDSSKIDFIVPGVQ